MCNDQLYLSMTEQGEALHLAGFCNIRQLPAKGSLVLYHAT